MVYFICFGVILVELRYPNSSRVKRLRDHHVNSLQILFPLKHITHFSSSHIKLESMIIKPGVTLACGVYAASVSFIKGTVCKFCR